MIVHNVNSIIRKDSKWLLHFLKEKHILKQYLIKIHNSTDMDKKPKNYQDWIKQNINKKEYYLSGYEKLAQANDWKQLILTNRNLIQNNSLFSSWYYRPFAFVVDNNYIINDSLNVKESFEWSKVLNRYIELKTYIGLIYEI